MNALVIENQYRQDAEIDGLVKDHPDIFSDVKVITGSLHRKPEELILELKDREALIISSTFMRKDQLENITELLVNLQPKHIYVRNLDTNIEEWQEEEHLFYDHEKFMKNIQTCLEKHEVFSFTEEWEDRTIKDKVWEQMKYADSTGRGKFLIEKITSL